MHYAERVNPFPTTPHQSRNARQLLLKEKPLPTTQYLSFVLCDKATEPPMAALSLTKGLACILCNKKSAPKCAEKCTPRLLRHKLNKANTRYACEMRAFLPKTKIHIVICHSYSSLCRKFIIAHPKFSVKLIFLAKISYSYTG